MIVIEIGIGKHATREDGMCAMEAVAWLAGEPHSDRPRCACPIIGTFVRSWNDALRGEDRNRILRPLLPQLIGSRSQSVERERAYMALDWLVHEFTPVWFDLLPELATPAAVLRALPRIVDHRSMRAVMRVVHTARIAAAAVCSANRQAHAHGVLSASGGYAARAAADIVRGTVVVAEDNVAYQAMAAARDAHVAAAKAAAELAPTVHACQQRALALLERMVRVEVG